MSGPLNGLRVIDFTQYVAGPYCAMILGDLGAQVIKVERPGIGDVYRKQGPHFIHGESVSFLSMNRNKRSLTVNLKAPQAQEIMARLLPSMDVLVENNTPGTMSRLGLGYDQVSQINPRLVYASLSAYGQTGPMSSEGGYDLVLQGLTGLLSMTGEPGGRPAKTPIAALDLGAGMFTALGIVSALLVRERTGKGQWIDCAMLDCAVSWLGMHLLDYKATGELPAPMGSASQFFAPYQAFRTRDGYIVIVGTGGTDAWQRLCSVLGAEYLVDDARFETNAGRVKNLPALVEELEKALTQHDSAYWLERLQAAGVICGPLNSLDGLFEHAQVRHREMIQDVPHPVAGNVPLPGVPVKLSDTPGSITAPPPQLGQDTEAILASVGYSRTEIDALRAAGVI